MKKYIFNKFYSKIKLFQIHYKESAEAYSRTSTEQYTFLRKFPEIQLFFRDIHKTAFCQKFTKQKFAQY